MFQTNQLPIRLHNTYKDRQDKTLWPQTQINNQNKRNLKKKLKIKKYKKKKDDYHNKVDT